MKKQTNEDILAKIVGVSSECIKKYGYNKVTIRDALNAMDEVRKLFIPDVKKTVCWSCGIPIKHYENGLPHYMCMECGAVH